MIKRSDNIRADLEKKRRLIAELNKLSLVIGVQKEEGINWKGQKKSGTDKYPSKKPKHPESKRSNMTVLDVALIHEFGCRIKVTDNMHKYSFIPEINRRIRKDTTEIVIPERAFIRVGRANTIDDVFVFMKANIHRVLSTYEWTPQRFMEETGQRAVELLVGTLGQGIPQKKDLSKLTGENDATLVGSGALQSHITYRVVTK